MSSLRLIVGKNAKTSDNKCNLNNNYYAYLQGYF